MVGLLTFHTLLLSLLHPGLGSGARDSNLATAGYRGLTSRPVTASFLQECLSPFTASIPM